MLMNSYSLDPNRKYGNFALVFQIKKVKKKSKFEV